MIDVPHLPHFNPGKKKTSKGNALAGDKVSLKF